MNLSAPSQPPVNLPQRPAGPSSQIVCSSCRTLLMYPQGAQNVRCARCGHVTSPPVAGGSQTAQLVCSNNQCRVVLMYPRGASQVQCSVCSNINCAMQANSIGHLVCQCCQITLMYAHGAQSVKCAVCNHVTPVGPGPGPQGRAHEGSAEKRPQAVVIQNPTTLDADGNEVENIAVGLKSERSGLNGVGSSA
ncbi:hypothetical protein WJX74_005358 [Apatococcus lobatus]|uniref:Zinc finger LSD1-type domain-containing protein n=1 Tax=Apatococcus lobatus TaxID=904363 RepID=A0AAW1SEJ3_9CHLO